MTSKFQEKNAGLAGRPLVQAVVLIILAIAVYSNTFQVPFVFDDLSSISENPVVQKLGNFIPGGGGYSDRPNRFIGYLTFALNYHFGGLDVVGYHAVNLAIHISTALLVYSLVRLTFQTPFFLQEDDCSLPSPSHGGSGWGWGSFLPFLVAALFVVHPVQTQAVTYIVQRLTSLTALFYLGAVVFYIRWRLARAAGAGVTSLSVLPWWLLSILCAVLAMKTKEIAFTLPLALLLYEYSFFRPRRQWAMLSPLLLSAAIIPLSMVSVVKPVDQLVSNVSAATAEVALSRWDYLCTQFNVIVTYLRLLVLPINQNLDYAYPISRTILEARTITSLLLLLALAAGAGCAFYFSRARRYTPGSPNPSPANLQAARLFAFGIFWFFITLSVESSLVPIRDVIFEHRLYLPSVGFFLAVSAPVLAMLTRRSSALGMPSMAALAIIVLLLGGTAYARNGVWENWETLWRDVLSKNPQNARAYNNLGTYYGNNQHYWEAIGQFEKAAKIYPRYLDAHFNLGRAYLVVGRYGDAAQEFRKTLTIDPNHLKAMEFLAQLEILLRNGVR